MSAPEGFLRLPEGRGTVVLTLDNAQAEYLLERLGGPLFTDSTSSARELHDAISHDVIVGQLERGLGVA